MAVTSLLLTKISVVIPKILLCDDSSMAAVLNVWMAVIRKLTKLLDFTHSGCWMFTFSCWKNDITSGGYE
jgi:hypothetical protein